MRKMSRYFVIIMTVAVVLTTQSYSSVYADEVDTADELVIGTEDTDVTGPGEIADDEDSTEEDTVNIPDEDEIRSEVTEEPGDIDVDYEDIPDSDETVDPDGVAAGQYSFGTDWSQWSQAYFYDATVKKNACRIIAYSKMMVQAGAVPMSDVTSGRFNPGVFYDWCAGNGWFSDGIITEKGSSGDCAKAFAKNIYGVTLYMTSNSVSGWSDGDKINKAMEGVNAGYTVIIGGNTHYACVHTAVSKSNNYPYVSDSGSTVAGQTKRIENVYKGLGVYTNIRFWSCSGTPTPSYDAPYIKSVTVASKDTTAGTYTVDAVVHAQQELRTVQFPTWTANNDQDDIIWGTGTYVSQSGYDKTYRYVVRISDHNNERGTYYTHVYAYGNDGTQGGSSGVSVNMDPVPEIISAGIGNDYTGIRYASGEYDVEAIVYSAAGIDRVEFQVWTDKNGKDDIVKSKGVLYTTGSTGREWYKYTVKISDHGNSHDIYHTQVVVYDKNGQSSTAQINDVDFRIHKSGVCGENLNWMLTGPAGDMTLTITGTGKMKYKYPNGEWELINSYENVPWVTYSKQIHHISLSDGLTSIGNYAFADCPLEDISIPSTVNDIGDHAFRFTDCGEERELTLNPSPEYQYYQVKINSFCDAGIKKVYLKGNAKYIIYGVDDNYSQGGGEWFKGPVTEDEEYTDRWGMYHHIIGNGYKSQYEMTIKAHSFDKDVTLYYLGDNEEMKKEWTIPEYKGYKTAEYIAVTGVRLDRTSAKMAKGETLTLKATVSPSNAVNQRGKWKSSSTDVATVTSEGVVKGISPGTATITVTTEDGAKTAYCEVIVKSSITDPSLQKISIRNVQIILSKTTYTYNGKNRMPVIKCVTLYDKVLQEGTDYYVERPGESKNVGQYIITVIGKGDYTGTAETAYRINKAGNTLKITGKTVNVGASTVRSKSRTIPASKFFKVSKKNGKLTYKKTKGNKKITVAKTGKVTIKSGIKKGKYKVKVKVTAAGDKNHKKASKTVTFTVRIK